MGVDLILFCCQASQDLKPHWQSLFRFYFVKVLFEEKIGRHLFEEKTSNESPLFLSLFHAFPLDLPLKLKSMLLKVRLIFYSSGPLMASINAVMDADAGCLLMLLALPLGRGIVSLDCGYKWLPGGLNYSFWIRQKQWMHNQNHPCFISCLFYLVFLNFILFWLRFISIDISIWWYNLLKC